MRALPRIGTHKLPQAKKTKPGAKNLDCGYCQGLYQPTGCLVQRRKSFLLQHTQPHGFMAWLAKHWLDSCKSQPHLC